MPSTRTEMSFELNSVVWVWDSTWLPAVVLQPVRTGCLLVRLEHGVTFSVNKAAVVPRDPNCRGSDLPSVTARGRGLT